MTQELLGIEQKKADWGCLMVTWLACRWSSSSHVKRDESGLSVTPNLCSRLLTKRRQKQITKAAPSQSISIKPSKHEFLKFSIATNWFTKLMDICFMNPNQSFMPFIFPFELCCFRRWKHVLEISSCIVAYQSKARWAEIFSQSWEEAFIINFILKRLFEELGSECFRRSFKPTPRPQSSRKSWPGLPKAIIDTSDNCNYHDFSVDFSLHLAMIVPNHVLNIYFCETFP